MEVQAAVGVEAEAEAAAWGMRSRRGPGGLREHPLAKGGWPVSEKLDMHCSRMTQKSLQSFRRCSSPGLEHGKKPEWGLPVIGEMFFVREEREKNPRFRIFQWALDSCLSSFLLCILPPWRKKNIHETEKPEFLSCLQEGCHQWSLFSIILIMLFNPHMRWYLFVF